MLRTTMNMHSTTFLKLSVAAAQIRKSRREVVIMLLMRIMGDINRFQGGFTPVRYQERDPQKRWHCFSISFGKDEYEFFTDLRKLSKFSVSYLVEIATKLYLSELLQEGARMHNYVKFTHYAVGQRREGGIICWELYWGDPGDIPKAANPTRIQRRTGAPKY